MCSFVKLPPFFFLSGDKRVFEIVKSESDADTVLKDTCWFCHLDRYARF